MCSHLILSILHTVKSKVILVCVCFQSLSCVPLFSTPWTVACQAPLSMGFPREEYCSGLPLPPPGDLPGSGIEPVSPALQMDALPSEPPGKPLLGIALPLLEIGVNSFLVPQFFSALRWGY